MPEGPEIRNAADEIAEALAGQVATDLFFAFDELKSYEEKLAGQTITGVESRGKAILIRFGNGLNIYSHNQLYGKWLILEGHDYPDTNRQLRLAIHNEYKSALLYSASEIEILRDDELDSHSFLGALGPDVLDESTTIEQVIDLFMHKDFHRRKITSLLLDQHFLAGLGNYLRSEVMFAAGIHPSLKPADCSGQQIRHLAQAILTLARRSYETGGITTAPELVEQLQEKGYAWEDYRFWVFNREDEPCFVCGTPVVKDEFGGRRFYYCPNCQATEEE